MCLFWGECILWFYFAWYIKVYACYIFFVDYTFYYPMCPFPSIFLLFVETLVCLVLLLPPCFLLVDVCLNSFVHPFIFNHSMSFLMYLLYQSDTARGTPFFLGKRTLGNTPRPKEHVSLPTLQLNMAMLSICGWREGKENELLLLFFLSFLLICNEDGTAEASSSHLGPRGDLEDGSHMPGEGSRKKEAA